MPDLIKYLLDKEQGFWDKLVTPEPVGLPDMPPPPPGYGFSMADKKEHIVPKVRIVDQREGVDPRKSFTGKYPVHIIQELIAGAKHAGIDPALALSMGLQESNLGTVAGSSGRSNPMQINPPMKWAGVKSTGPFPSDALLGHLDDNQTSQEARDSLDREWSIGQAMQHLKKDLTKFPDNLEHAVQSYNGLGKPYGDQPMYGITGRGNLPTDFYGKRVLDLRDNVVNKSPFLQEMMERVK